MKKAFLFAWVILSCVGMAFSQNLPDLPSAPPTSSGLPDLPVVDNAPLAPAASHGVAELPVLPLPGDSGTASSVGLPALPGESAVIVPAVETPVVDKKDKKKEKKKDKKKGEKEVVAPAPVAETSPAVLPALPGEAVPAVTQPAPAPAIVGVQAASVDETKTAVPVGEAKKKAVSLKKKPEGPEPNTIFGGWVAPKGSGEAMHLSWSSQEIMNAMLGNRYEFVKEDGEYSDGGWREFTFRHSKTKRQVMVYVKQVRNKVWMRVGPPEPPAGVSFAESVQVRKDSETALKILRKKFGGRFSSRGGTWEAPFNRPRS